MLKSYICTQPVGVITTDTGNNAKKTLPSTAANKPIAVSLDSMVSLILFSHLLLSHKHY